MKILAKIIPLSGLFIILMLSAGVSRYSKESSEIVLEQGHVVGDPAVAVRDTVSFNQAQALAELRKKIAGSENKPAEEVFKNIQLLKGVPAGRLLAIMEIGYAKSLGVTCTHCHVADQWEKEDKPTKQIVREMSAMVKVINTQQLKQIKNLKSENPIVNCTTCHRGQTKPALNIP